MLGDPSPSVERLEAIAAASPSTTALVHCTRSSQQSLSWRELNTLSRKAATFLAEHGVTTGSMVLIALPGSSTYFYPLVFGAWRLGACVIPASPSLSEEIEHREAQAGSSASPSILSSLASSGDLLAVSSLPLSQNYKTVSPSTLGRIFQCAEYDSHTYDVPCDYAMLTGGTTGLNKIVYNPRWEWHDHLVFSASSESDGTQLDKDHPILISPANLHHGHGWLYSLFALRSARTVILAYSPEVNRDLAEHTVDLIEEYKPNFLSPIPSLMTEILELPDIATRDLTSIAKLLHATSPLPIHIKEQWLSLIGPEHVHEFYGSSEATGLTAIAGPDWLAHRGSVGRPVGGSEVRVRDEKGQDVPTHTIGEIYMRRSDILGPSHSYLNRRPAKQTYDGFVTTGDLGWLDDEGFLYLGDRAGDTFLSRRIRVHPSEIESMIYEIEGILDAVVIGIPDGRVVNRIHAIIQVTPRSQVTSEEVIAYCTERLPSWHPLDSCEISPSSIRSPEGKVNRAVLAGERLNRNFGQAR